MDLDLLDLRQAAEREYWVHLRLGNTKLYSNMDDMEGPCRVKVASVANPEVERQITAVERVGKRFSHAEFEYSSAKDGQVRKALEKRLDLIDSEASKLFSKFLQTIVLDWENLEKDGKPLPFSPEALADLSEKGAPLFRMATEIAEDAGKAQHPFTQAEGA